MKLITISAFRLSIAAACLLKVGKCGQKLWRSYCIQSRLSTGIVRVGSKVSLP